MTIPQTYRKSPTSITSYDWREISSGLGMIKFYLCISKITSGQKHILTEYAIPSDGNVETGDYETYEFDLTPFNISRIIEGKGYICLNGRAYNGDETNWTVKLQKIDENENVIDITDAVTSSLVGENPAYINVSLDISSTIFKRGERLRLQIITGNRTFRTYTDPFREESSIIYIPFKINL